MINRRQVFRLFSLAATGALLGGCGRREEPLAQAAEADSGLSGEDALDALGRSSDLTLLAKASDSTRPYLQRALDLYRQEAGHAVNLVAVADAEFEGLIQTAYDAGRPPDLLLHFNDYQLRGLLGAGALVDLGSEEWVQDLQPSVRSYCDDGSGGVAGLPFWENSVSGCYYNKQVLRELGLRAPTTQAEFDTLCRLLSETGHVPLCWGDAGCAWMYQFGLDPVFADAPALLEDLNNGRIGYAQIPAVSGLLTWLHQAAEKGWLGSEPDGLGWDDLPGAVASGDAAMILVWDTWFDTEFVPGTFQREDFGLMPVFLGTAPAGTFEGGNLNLMLVPEDAPRREQALELLRFCAEPDTYNAAFQGVVTLSCFKRQTTHHQSPMVTEVWPTVSANLRPSTAQPKINGYSQVQTAQTVLRHLKDEITLDQCLEQLDQSRLACQS